MIRITFDFIVVGSGSAGSVLVNRLTADPRVTVALVEAGPSDRPFPTNVKTALPIGNIFLLPDSRFNWKYSVTAKGPSGIREIPYPRGKLFGGSSSINGSVYIRGQPEDYASWVASGNPGWSYEEVLTEYREMENFRGPAGPFHGVGGELDVQRPHTGNPLSYAFVKAGAQAGYAQNEDFNGSSQDGVGRYHVNQRDGIRVSSSRAFLHPVLHRTNLTVFSRALARRIEISGQRARGVEIEQDGRVFNLLARREVIVCGGAINSPQLLMLSGIGPAEHLRQFGIQVVRDAPGVGANLQDHPTVYIAMENPSAEAYALSSKAAWRVATSPLSYLLARRGMLASNVAEAGAFIRTLPPLTRPDIQMTLLVGLKSNALTIPRQHGYMLIVQLLRPTSTGSVQLSGPNAADPPIIDLNLIGSEQDVSTLVRGIRAARNILDQPALAGMSGQEIAPGRAMTSEEALKQRVRDTVTTAYHPVDTCKMGPASDPMAVVEPDLKVRGIAGLRVADTSIMPSIVSGNTSAPAMMIGARAAKFIVRAAPDNE